MGILDGLNEKIEESNNRWKRIDELYNKLKNYDNLSVCEEALMLIIDQLRPAYDAKEQAGVLQEQIENMLEPLTKMMSRNKKW